jgi:hypothetical protein
MGDLGGKKEGGRGQKRKVRVAPWEKTIRLCRHGSAHAGAGDKMLNEQTGSAWGSVGARRREEEGKRGREGSHRGRGRLCSATIARRTWELGSSWPQEQRECMGECEGKKEGGAKGGGGNLTGVDSTLPPSLGACRSWVRAGGREKGECMGNVGARSMGGGSKRGRGGSHHVRSRLHSAAIALRELGSSWRTERRARRAGLLPAPRRRSLKACPAGTMLKKRSLSTTLRRRLKGR